MFFARQSLSGVGSQAEPGNQNISSFPGSAFPRSQAEPLPRSQALPGNERPPRPVLSPAEGLGLAPQARRVPKRSLGTSSLRGQTLRVRVESAAMPRILAHLESAP